MNKVKVLVVIILVLVAFSAPALVNGYVESDEYYEGDGYGESDGYYEGNEYDEYHGYENDEYDEGDGYGEGDGYDEGDVYDEYPGYENDEYDEGDKNGEGGGIPSTKTGDKDKKFPKSAAAVVITTIAVAAGVAVGIKNREKIKDKWFSTSQGTKSIGETVAEAPPAPPSDTTPEIVQLPPEPPVNPYEQYRRARSRTAQNMAAAQEFSRDCKNSSRISYGAGLIFGITAIITGGASLPVAAALAGIAGISFGATGKVADEAGAEAQKHADKKKRELELLDKKMRDELKKKQQEK